MKTIGIMTRIDVLNNKSIHYIPSDIFYKVKDKVNVIIIPFRDKDKLQNIIHQINLCDGIILPGGDDIYPLELELCKYLYQANIPTLGICLGMQTMACAIDGTLGTLPNLKHKSKETYVHIVNIYQNSLLYKIIKEKKIIVNSRHKDYVTNTKLSISASSDDNIIEAIEDQNKKFFLGLQWHPENLNDEYSHKIFDYFVDML